MTNQEIYDRLLGELGEAQLERGRMEALHQSVQENILHPLQALMTENGKRQQRLMRLMTEIGKGAAETDGRETRAKGEGE